MYRRTKSTLSCCPSSTLALSRANRTNTADGDPGIGASAQALNVQISRRGGNLRVTDEENARRRCKERSDRARCQRLPLPPRPVLRQWATLASNLTQSSQSSQSNTHKKSNLLPQFHWGTSPLSIAKGGRLGAEPFDVKSSCPRCWASDQATRTTYGKANLVPDT